MNVKGNANLFVKKNEKGFNNYSLSLSSKDKDGNYINGRLECVFDGKAYPEEKRNKKLKEGFCYQIEIEEGFIGVRQYKNAENKIIKVLYVYIQKCKILNEIEIKNAQPVDEGWN